MGQTFCVGSPLAPAGLGHLEENAAPAPCLELCRARKGLSRLFAPVAAQSAWVVAGTRSCLGGGGGGGGKGCLADLCQEDGKVKEVLPQPYSDRMEDAMTQLWGQEP